MSLRKPAALMLVMLIIILPATHAEMIAVEKISGVDNTNNFIRSNDMLTINALVNMPGDSSVERDQLRVYLDTSQDYMTFESCNPVSQGSLCIFKKNLYSQTGMHDYHIELFTDATKSSPQAAPEEKVSEPVSVDAMPPALKSFDFEPKITGSGDIIITYAAEDYSEGTDKSVCSGISNIRVAKEDFLGEQIAQIEGGDQCEATGSYAVSVSGEGRFDVCAFAVENMGRTSNSICKELIVDRTPPVIREVRIYRDGERITHIGKHTATSVDIEVIFDELALGIVRGDFSNIARGRAGNVVAEVEGNKAFFKSIQIGGFHACRFSIKAEDKTSNILDSSVDCLIRFDELGPEVLDFESSRKDAPGNNLAAGEAEFRVLLKEDQSGLYKKQAYLDLSSIGMGAKEQARECAKQANEWVCKWDVSASRGRGKQAITIFGSDDSGNPITGLTNHEIIVDLQKPIVEFIGVNAINDFDKRVFIAGDMLQFEFIIEDFGSAYADLTNIGHGANELPDYCIGDTAEGKTLTKCYWRPVEILFSDSEKVQLPFYFFDNAGNKDAKTIVLELLERYDVETPNYWQIKDIECSPNPVDRAAALLVPQGYKVVCRIGLKAKHSGARVTHVSFNSANCEGDFNGKVLGIAATNTGPSMAGNQKDIYLSIILDNADFLMSDLTFTCPLLVSTRIGKRYVANAEEERARITLGFFDNPLGASHENYDNKIKNARDFASKIYKTTGNFELFFEKAKQLCGVKSTVSGLLGILDNIIALFGSAGDALKSTPATAGAGAAAHGTSEAIACGPKAALEDQYIGASQKFLGGISEKIAGADLFDLLEDFCRFTNCNLEGEKAPNDAYFRHMGDRLLSLSIIGGGAPWCTDTIDWINKEVLGEIKLAAQIDIKESLVLSIGCLCLPGIIRNLNKLAEVKCKYVLCMKEQVKKGGFPGSICEKEEAYDECMFVYNEIFNAIPMAAILNSIFAKWENIISNWPGLIFALAGGAVCSEAFCHHWAGYYGCIITKTLNKIADAVVSIKSVAEQDYWEIQTGYCKELFD